MMCAIVIRDVRYRYVFLYPITQGSTVESSLDLMTITSIVYRL